MQFVKQCFSNVTHISKERCAAWWNRLVGILLSKFLCSHQIMQNLLLCKLLHNCYLKTLPNLIKISMDIFWIAIFQYNNVSDSLLVSRQKIELWFCGLFVLLCCFFLHLIFIHNDNTFFYFFDFFVNLSLCFFSSASSFKCSISSSSFAILEL